MIGKIQTEVQRHAIRMAVAYCRVSSNKQRDNTSIPGQIDYLQKTLEPCGVIIKRIFEEVGSGKDAERAALVQAYEFCRTWNRKARREQDKIKLLAIYDWTRWFRNRDLSSHWRVKFRQIGIMVNCPSKWVDYTDAGSIILHSVQEGMAHAEHLVISDRAKKSHYDLAVNGKAAGKLPRWLLKTDKLGSDGKPIVELHPIIALAYKKAFQQVAAGIPAAEAYRMNGGHKVLGGRSSFYAMLSNALCAGRVIKKSNVEGLPDINTNSAYPALISWQMFEQVQQRLEPYKGSAKTVQSDVLFPAKGILRCPVCNGSTTSEMPLSGNGVTRHYYYRCSSKQAHGRFHKDGIDRLVKSIMSDLALSPAAAQYAQQQIKKRQQEARGAIQNKINTLHQRQQEMQQRVERARNLLIDGVLDKDDFAAVKQQLEALNMEIAEQSFFKENQGKVTQAAFQLLGNLNEVMRKASPKEISVLLQTIFPNGFTVEPGNYAVCRTQRLNTIFNISGLMSSSYASIKIETGSEIAARPAKGAQQDINRTRLDVYKSDFQAVMNCFNLMIAA